MEVSNFMIKTKLKIAYLFSGQLRNIDYKLFNKSLKLFLNKDFENKIYISTWDEIGVSMNHDIKNLQKKKNGNVLNLLNLMFNGFEIESQKIFNFEEWNNHQSDEYQEIQNSKDYTFLTKHSLPQLFLIEQSYKQIDLKDKFDFYIRVRFDSIFLFKFNENLSPNLVYNINFGRAYHDSRIYDIFFIVPFLYAETIFNTYSKVTLLLNNSFNNRLEKRDACRLLFISLKLDYPGIEVKSLNKRYCDIYRPKNSFSKYVLENYGWGIGIDLKYQEKVKFFYSILILSPISFLKVVSTIFIHKFLYSYRFNKL
jgi:hypothetical protein